MRWAGVYTGTKQKWMPTVWRGEMGWVLTRKGDGALAVLKVRARYKLLHLKLVLQAMPWERRPTGCVRHTYTPPFPSGQAREGLVTSSALTSLSTLETWETSTSVSLVLELLNVITFWSCCTSAHVLLFKGASQYMQCNPCLQTISRIRPSGRKRGLVHGQGFIYMWRKRL